MSAVVSYFGIFKEFSQWLWIDFFSRQRVIVAVLVTGWRWRVYTLLCISSYFALYTISRLSEARFQSAAMLCFCAHTVMEALPIKLSPLAFEKVGPDLRMTRPPSASWLRLLPSSITNAIWVSPHTHLCFLGLCHRVRPRLKHRGRGEEQGRGRSWKIAAPGTNLGSVSSC